MYVIITTNYKKDTLFSNCVIERMCLKESCHVWLDVYMFCCSQFFEQVHFYYANSDKH